MILEWAPSSVVPLQYPSEARVAQGWWHIRDTEEADNPTRFRAWYAADDFTSSYGREQYVMGPTLEDVKGQIQKIEDDLAAAG